MLSNSKTDGTKRSTPDGLGTIEAAMDHARAIERLLATVESEMVARDRYALRMGEAMTRSLIDQLGEILKEYREGVVQRDASSTATKASKATKATSS